MSTKDTIINKLREAFAPESLDVADESHLHEGHAGHRPGGETHFRVYIVSLAFEGKSRIAYGVVAMSNVVRLLALKDRP